MLTEAWRNSGDRLAKLLFILMIGVHLLPVWILRYFPTQDGPSHVYIATVLGSYFDPRQELLRRYYTVNLALFPNWLTSLLLVGLLHGVSLVIAEKALISLYLVGLPLAVRYALRGLGKNALWASVLVFPILYNDLFHRGFYNFAASVVIFFTIIGYWFRYRCSMRARQLAVLTLMVLLLYFSHIVALVSLVITLIVLEVFLTFLDGTKRATMINSSLRGICRAVGFLQWRSLLCFIPALILAINFLLQQGGGISYSSYSWKTLAWWMYGVIPLANTPVHLLSGVSVALLWVIVFAYSLAQRKIHCPGFYFDGFFASGVALFALYLLAPESLSGGSFLNQRLLLFALLLIAIWFGSLGFNSRARASITIAAVGIALLNVALHVQVYSRISKDSAQYLSAAKLIGSNGTLVALCFASEGCGVGLDSGYLRISPLSHLSGYIAAEHNLVSLSNDHAQMNYFPIRYRPDLDPGPYTVTIQSGGRRVWGRNLPNYADKTGGDIDYVLLWSIADAWHRGEDTDRLMRWLSEQYVLILATGELRLYQKLSNISDTNSVPSALKIDQGHWQ